MGRRSSRSRYRSVRTKRQLDNLPDWIVKDPSSALWNLLNPGNILIDDAGIFVQETRENRLPTTYNKEERNPIYVAGPQASDPSATYSSESGAIEIAVTDELEEFFFGIPTRISSETGNIKTLPDVPRVPIDVQTISKIKLDSDDDELPESGALFAVLQENTYADADAFVFYDRDWNFIKGSSIEIGRQDYDSQPDDEWVELNETGNYYRLDNFPIRNTIKIKNVLSLDAWGEAQEIPTGYTVQGRDITFDDSISESGIFIAEYDYIPDKALLSFAPVNYEGPIGSQGLAERFIDSIIRIPSNDLVTSPSISGELDSGDVHTFVSVRDIIPVNAYAAKISNSIPYLRFHPDELRPGMEAIVNYRNAFGKESEQILTAERVNNDYDIYLGEAYYATGVDVTSFVSGDYSTFGLDNFKVSRHTDYASVTNGMEDHIYERGRLSHNPYYLLDRVGQYIEEHAPESGGYVRRNLVGGSYTTSDLPDLRSTHPEIQSVLFNSPRILDPSVPDSVPVSIRRWGSWILMLRRNYASVKPYSRYIEPINQNETGNYSLAILDIDTWEESEALPITLGLEPTAFTVDGNMDAVHILGYEELSMDDASTKHTITIDDQLNISLPTDETMHRYDTIEFTVDIPSPTASVRIQHIPSGTMEYNSDTSHSGEFTAQGWGTYQISGESGSEYFNKTFEVEPSTNRRIWRQKLRFHYDYAITVPVDDEQEVIYFRERYKWGIDRDTTAGA